MAVEILYPTVDWSATWDPSTGTSHYALLDEVSADDADYVSTATNFEYELFAFSNTSAASGQPINHVDSNIRMKYGATSGTLYVATKTSQFGTTYNGTNITLTSANYTNYVYEWATNPATGAAWTSAEIDAHGFGFRSIAASNTLYVSQYNVGVDYAAGGSTVPVFMYHYMHH